MTSVRHCGFLSFFKKQNKTKKRHNSRGFSRCCHERGICLDVRACLCGFPLFASGLGMKGPGGLVREERADVSWPVGTWFSRIRLPSLAGSGSTLTRSHSLSCLSPVPLHPPTPLPSAAALSLSASAYFFFCFVLFYADLLFLVMPSGRFDACFFFF